MRREALVGRLLGGAGAWALRASHPGQHCLRAPRRGGLHTVGGLPGGVALTNASELPTPVHRPAHGCLFLFVFLVFISLPARALPPWFSITLLDVFPPPPHLSPLPQDPAECAIRYVAVARLHDHLPVAHHATIDTPALPAAACEEKVTRVLRSRRVAAHSRLTITDNEVGCIHFDSAPPCMYLVVTPREVPQRVAFQVLAELAAAFEPTWGPTTLDAPPGARPWGLTPKVEGLLMQVTAPYNGAAGAAAAAAGGMLGGGGGVRVKTRPSSLTIDVTDSGDEEAERGELPLDGRRGAFPGAYGKGGGYATDGGQKGPATGGPLTPRGLLVALSNEAFGEAGAGGFSWCRFVVITGLVVCLVIGVPALVVLARS